MLRPSGKKLGRLEKKGRDDLRTDSRIAFGSIKNDNNLYKCFIQNINNRTIKT